MLAIFVMINGKSITKRYFDDNFRWPFGWERVHRCHRRYRGTAQSTTNSYFGIVPTSNYWNLKLKIRINHDQRWQRLSTAFYTCQIHKHCRRSSDTAYLIVIHWPLFHLVYKEKSWQQIHADDYREYYPMVQMYCIHSYCSVSLSISMKALKSIKIDHKPLLLCGS